jgi:hypothetical protein
MCGEKISSEIENLAEPIMCIFLQINELYPEPSPGQRQPPGDLSVSGIFSPGVWINGRGGMSHLTKLVGTRVSSETSFVSKQPKLEPKLVLALSETRRLFRLFRFNIETGSFGVLKQPKQTKDKLKQQQILLKYQPF